MVLCRLDITMLFWGALNRMHIVAVTIILVLHVGIAGRATYMGIWGAARPLNVVIPIWGLGVDGVSHLLSFPHRFRDGFQLMCCSGNAKRAIGLVCF